GRQRLHQRAELLHAPLEDVVDRGRNQLGLGGEVVQLRAAGHAGPPAHLGGGGGDVAALGQALGGGVEELGAGGRRALRLRGHAGSLRSAETNSQACMFVPSVTSAAASSEICAGDRARRVQIF